MEYLPSEAPTRGVVGLVECLDFELGNVAWIPFPLYTGLTRDCMSVFALLILTKFTFRSYLYPSSFAREVPCESFDLCRIFLQSLNHDTFID